MSIKIVKLKSGEEIITKVIDNTNDNTEDNNDIILDTPAVLMQHPVEKQLILVPWLPYADKDSYVISRDNIMVMADVKQEIADAYNQTFGKIMTPNANKQLIV